MKQTLKKTKAPEDRMELQAKLTRLQQDRANHARHEHLRNLRIRHKRTEREKVAGGKKPFFLKRRVQREAALAERCALGETWCCVATCVCRWRRVTLLVSCATRVAHWQVQGAQVEGHAGQVLAQEARAQRQQGPALAAVQAPQHGSWGRLAPCTPMLWRWHCVPVAPTA